MFEPARRLAVLLTLTAIAALVLTTFAGSAPLLAQSGPQLVRGAWLDGAEIVPGQVIVRYAAGTTQAERRDAVQDQRADVAEPLGLPRTDLVELPEGVSVEAAIGAFEADPDIAYAEPNHVSHVSAIPNDTRFAELWGLNQASDKDIDAPEAWDLTTGSSSIVVAVIDSGVAYDHPDLAQNIWTNDDPAGGGDDDGNGFVDDTHGWDFVSNDNAPLDANEHGTHVAGTIGARGNNALGVTGVNWQVSVMPVRAGDAGGGLTDSAIISAIQYACANGARVANGSFGGGGFSQATLDAINSAACANTLFVFAAGNGGGDGVGDNNDATPTYPCNYNTTRIVCVAATTQTDTRASFSNFGVTNVDLAAPGVGTLSTMPNFVTVLSDGFENSPTLFSTRWGAQSAPAGHPTWGQQAPGFSGSFLLSDSPSGNYSANTDTTIRSLTPMNLTGLAGCALTYVVNVNMRPGDFFTIEAAQSTAGPWTNVRLDPFNGQDMDDFFDEAGDAGVIDGKSTAYLRFRITSNGSQQNNGVRVDNLTFACVATPSATGDYQLLSGTSMATPHVAGAAALVLARNPALTTAQVRSILLTTVDPVAGLNVASGGRLNLRNAVAAAEPDTTPPPVPTIDSGPTGTVASTTAIFGFSDTEAGVTFECRVDIASFASCISPKQFTGLGQGAHTFDVRAKDANGNTSSSVSRSWTVDTLAPPLPTIDSGPSGTVASTTASFTFSDTEAGATFECRVDAASFATCVSPKQFTSLGQGAHTFDVRAKDANGNTSSSVSRSWTVDTVGPPLPTIDSGPTGTVASTTANFTFSDTDGGATFECRIDAALFGACTSPAQFTSLGQGAHTFDVRAKDAVGNTSSVASRSWTVDTVAPPVPTIDTGPTGTVASTAASFTFSDTEGGATFECRIDAAAFGPCISPKQFTSLGQGAHTFDVRAKDAAGNTSSSVSRSWTVDTVAPPVPTIDTGPTGAVASTTASFTFSDTEAGATFECRVDTASFATCVSPKQFTSLGQGPHTFDVRAKDVLGNTSSTASRAWTVDTVAPPVPTIDSGPTGTVASTTASFTFSDTEGTATFECRVDAASFGSCTSPTQFTSLGQGAHTFEVRAKDALGNTSSAVSRSWAVDTVAPPVPSIDSGPTGTVASTDANFAFSDTEGGAVFECRIDTVAFGSCTSPAQFTSLGQGAHTFDVRAKDTLNNTSAVASRAWIVDTVAPPIPTIDSGPTGTVASTDANFAFSDTDGGATFECRLDSAAFAPCATPKQFTSLGQGPHTFDVLAKDAVGNTSAATSRAWSVDTVAPPLPTIDSGPTGTVASTTATFTFSDTEGSATFECRVDAVAFGTCTSPKQFTSLGEGAHTFEVRAKDAVDNTSAAASRGWSVDTVSPAAPTINSGPTGTVASTTASFTFSHADGSFTFECRLDTAAFGACTSPTQFTNLGQGPHTFDVRAKDGVGNPSLLASRTWTVDTVAPPLPTIDSGPAGTVASTNATFGFSDTEAGVTFECRVDAAPFGTCVSPTPFPGLGQGAHSFEVRAKDAVGNTSAASSRAWSIDTVRPTTTITASPAKTTTSRTATFRFKSGEAGSTFRCRLDGGVFKPCSSGKTYRRLAKGFHTFRVRATDKAGNIDATPAKRNWTIR